MNAVRLGVVLLAAGKSERFGSNKLLADFGGQPMVCRALRAVQAVSAHQICLVTGCDEVAGLARACGFDVVMNTEAHLGQSHSIHLGIAAMQGMDAVLLMVCDQPRLTGESLARLISAYRASPKGIACLRDDTHMGNPAVFARKYFPQLLALSGDRGAKGILTANADDLLVVPCIDGNELADADTPRALAQMRSADGK